MNVGANRIVGDKPDAAKRAALPDGDHSDFTGRVRLVIPTARESEKRIALSRRGQPEKLDLVQCGSGVRWGE
jgi:hypothetical protein